MRYVSRDKDSRIYFTEAEVDLFGGLVGESVAPDRAVRLGFVALDILGQELNRYDAIANSIYPQDVLEKAGITNDVIRLKTIAVTLGEYSIGQESGVVEEIETYLQSSESDEHRS